MKHPNETHLTLYKELLNFCLENISNPTHADWFRKKMEEPISMASFFLSFGLVSKKIERAAIAPSEALKKILTDHNPAFDQTAWTLDEFARLALLLLLNTEQNKDYISKLLSSADRRELTLIYKSIQYLPNSEDFKLIMADGIRTNMVDVFDAIALHNSFGFSYFDDAAWNQMVLKAIFMERPIYKIFGLDVRNNEKLAQILHDFVQERRAAGRLISPELWRMMNGFVSPAMAEDMIKEVALGHNLARLAAAKILLGSNNSIDNEWITLNKSKIETTHWDEIGKAFYELSEIV